MARKKAAEIAELQNRLRAQVALYAEAEPLLPIAEALRDAVNARLVGERGDALIDVDGAFDAALAQVAETLIASKLETLDPETVLRVYAEQTRPVLSYYSNLGVLRTVRAEGALEEITQRLLVVLEPKPAGSSKKRAAKRRTTPAKARVRKAARGKPMSGKKTAAKRRAAPKKRAPVRKVARKTVRKVVRKARPARGKSKRR